MGKVRIKRKTPSHMLIHVGDGVLCLSYFPLILKPSYQHYFLLPYICSTPGTVKYKVMRWYAFYLDNKVVFKAPTAQDRSLLVNKILHRKYQCDCLTRKKDLVLKTSGIYTIMFPDTTYRFNSKTWAPMLIAFHLHRCTRCKTRNCSSPAAKLSPSFHSNCLSSI